MKAKTKQVPPPAPSNDLKFEANACWVTNVIISTKTIRGDDTEGNPKRFIIEILTTDGKKIAEHDPIK